MLNVASDVVVECLLIEKSFSSRLLDCSLKSSSRNSDDCVCESESVLHQLINISELDSVRKSSRRLQLSLSVLAVLVVHEQRIQSLVRVLVVCFEILNRLASRDPSILRAFAHSKQKLSVSVVDESLNRSHLCSDSSPGLLVVLSPALFSEYRNDRNV